MRRRQKIKQVMNVKIKFYLYKYQPMSDLTLSRHYQSIHQLSQQQLTSHPNLIGRILYFAIPYLFVVIINIVLFTKILKVHEKIFVKTFPSNPYIAVIFVISIIGVGVCGIHAVLADSCSVKEWIVFTLISIFIGLHPLILSAETGPTLIVAIFVNILSAVLNQWFFVLLKDMPQATNNQLIWKHSTRNVVGFLQAALIIYTFQNIVQSLVHIFSIAQKTASYFFWILAPIFTILVLVWNIISFGPYIDLIGYVLAALLLFFGAAISTLFHKVVDYRESRQASPRK